MQKIVSKDQCPSCAIEGRDTAHDNLVTFDSGIRYCVAGHGTQSILNQKKDHMKTTEKLNDKFITGVYDNIKSRKISKKTCEFYGYQINREKNCHIANYYNAAGKVAMQQLRTADKQFPIIGDKSYNKKLWGMHKFTKDSRVFITITEGQIDALSVAEAFDCKYPVVSLPNGVSAAKEVLLHNKKYLEGFKYVVLAFDNDDPGLKATEECLRVLEPGKIRVAKWLKKDANEYLQAGELSEIRNIIYNAVEFIPDPILTGDQLIDSLSTYTAKTKEWPWTQANRVIQPIRIPAVYTIAAKPQVGKTEFVAEIMRKQIKEGNKIGIIALEQTIQQVLIKMTDSLLGTNLGEITNREYTEEEKKACKKIADKLVIYNHITYGSDLNQVVDNIPYMVKSLGCQIIIFDNISYSATGLDGDERRGIDKAMIALKDSTVKYNYTLFNVCHLKRDNNFIGDSEIPVTIEGIRGSQGIEMYSDYVIGLYRDKLNENIDVKNTLTAYVLKDRMTGSDTGKSFEMKFNPKTRRLS